LAAARNCEKRASYEVLALNDIKSLAVTEPDINAAVGAPAERSKGDPGHRS
jgi:hypothetical protein